MNFNFLSPVEDAVLAHNELLSEHALGRKLKINSQQHGVPELERRSNSHYRCSRKQE